MALTKFLDPKNDLAFKRLFGTEKNKDILIHFLNDIFERSSNPILDVSFLKTAQDPEISIHRASLLDILCTDQKGERFIVEMQVTNEPGFEKRAPYYAAKAYIEQRTRGQEYRDLKQVTFLAITGFTLFPDKQNCLSHHHMLDVVTGERNLEDFSFSFIELPKFKKSLNQLANIVDKWIYFFKHAEETSSKDLEKIIGSDEIIERAYEELDRYGWSEEELRAYDHVDMEETVHRTQIGAARTEGMVEGKIETARNMRALGIEDTLIAKATGLSLALDPGSARDDKINLQIP